MAQYVPVTSTFTPSQVGAVYHVGIGDGTNTYGYIFQPNAQAGMIERSNVADKSALIQYSSPNLIDRDLVYYPRVTQGDFSGGGLQTVFINANQYYDSDLEVRTPGLLTLRPAWKRTTLANPGGTYQCAEYNGDIYTAFGTSSVYNSSGSTLPSPGFNVSLLVGAGSSLIASDGSTHLSYYTGAWVSLTTSLLGARQMWYIDQGTVGSFIYYTPDNTTLYRFDLNALTSSQVGTGKQFWTIVDMCVYQTGLAIAARSSTSGFSDIWYYDGENLTLIAHITEYEIGGMTNCLGNLFVTANSTGSYEPPVLLEISSGSVAVAVRPGSPLIQYTTSVLGAPCSTGQYVYFAILSPQISAVTPYPYIGVYDSISESFSHLPNYGSDDAPQTSSIRQLACSGRAAAFPMTDGSGNAVLQFQTNSSFFPSGNTYMTGGRMVSSKIDFATPSIPKRFRRIEVQHDPLPSGCSVQVNAYVDQDPLNFNFALQPVPSTATVTNGTSGSSSTILTFGTPTVGKTLYYELILHGPGSTTPGIEYVSVEVGGTWTWEFVFDCSSRRRLLNSTFEDQQGVTGKDLYYLLRNAYENGTALTLYLAEGVSYTTQIESVDVVSPAYTDHRDVPVNADQEWTVHVILNQVA